MNLFDTIKYRIQYTFNKFIDDIFVKRQIRITYKLLNAAIKDFEKNINRAYITPHTGIIKLRDYLILSLNNKELLQDLRKSLNKYRLFMIVRKGTKETTITVYGLPEAFDMNNKEVVTTKVQLEKIKIQTKG